MSLIEIREFAKSVQKVRECLNCTLFPVFFDSRFALSNGENVREC